jgi:hypothetical protein
MSVAVQEKPSIQPSLSATKVQEKDRTHKFHITDKDGSIESTVLADDLYAMFQQFQTGNIAFMRQQVQIEITDIVKQIQQWVKQNESRIAEWELYQRSGIMRDYFRMQFTVVHKGLDYDDILAKQLSSLNIAIANNPQYKIVRVDVLMVPDASDADIVDAFT